VGSGVFGKWTLRIRQLCSSSRNLGGNLMGKWMMKKDDEKKLLKGVGAEHLMLK
jgi:hypothetical protein